MTTFDDLDVGDVFETPSRAIDDATVRTLIEAGGYTHPLFTDPEYAAASPFGATPLPGQAVLHIMGGLVEQSGRFDETVLALAGFEEVRFLAPALSGAVLRVAVEVVGKHQSGGRGTLVMRWRCLSDDGRVIAEAIARMLFRLVER